MANSLKKIVLSNVEPTLTEINLFVKNSAQIHRFEFITKILIFVCGFCVMSFNPKMS